MGLELIAEPGLLAESLEVMSCLESTVNELTHRVEREKAEGDILGSLLARRANVQREKGQAG